MRIESGSSANPGTSSDSPASSQDAWERSAHRRCIAPRDDFEASTPPPTMVNLQAMLQLMARR